MGTETKTGTFVCKASRVKTIIEDMIEEEKCDLGHGTYSGSLGQKSYHYVLEKTFESFQDFYDHCSIHEDDKWGDGIAVARIATSAETKEPNVILDARARYERVCNKIEGFRGSILAEMNDRVSATVSCKSCGKRHVITDMASIRCKKCKKDILTPTQLKQKASLQKAAKKYKNDLEKLIARHQRSTSSKIKREPVSYGEEIYDLRVKHNRFDETVLERVKSGKSKTKSCKHCNTRLNVSQLQISTRGREGFYNYSEYQRGEVPLFFDCPCCGRSMLSETDKSLKNKIASKITKLEFRERRAPSHTYGYYSACPS